MKTHLLALALALLSFNATAEFRVYKHVPELNFKSDEEAAKEESKEAFFVAMQGYTCYLPSEDSYCTVPLRWHNNMSDQVSIWRDGNMLASGYSGHIEATVRLGQSFDYYIKKGTSEQGQIVDAANVTALYDPNAMTGLLKSPNDGVCDISYGQKSCKQAVSWETNSPIAAIWLAKKGTPEKIQELTTKSGSFEVEIGAYANLYELRAGKSAEGNLMASVSVEGKPIEYSGTLALDEGSTCLVGSTRESCDLPVTWVSEKQTSVWVDNKRQTEPSAGGTGIVKVPYGAHKVVLRPENVLGTNLLTLNAEAKISDIKASITLNGEICTIGFADALCRATATISTNLEGVYLFKGDTRLHYGANFSYNLEHTEKGNVYTLRQGPDRDSQILATYLAKAEKQHSFGELVITGECVFPYKGATCTIPAFFKSNVEGVVVDSKGKNHSYYSSSWGNYYYPKEDEFNVTLTNDGNKTTTETFMLKAVDRSKAWLDLDTLEQQSVTGTLFENSGTLGVAESASCNLPSNRETCSIKLSLTSTTSVVTIWRNDGVKVYDGYAGEASRTVTVPAVEGNNTFYLKEGKQNLEGSLAEVNATGVRINYYASKDPSMIDSCSVRYLGTFCYVNIKVLSNLVSEPYSVYYLSSTNDRYDVYQKVSGHAYGNAAFSLPIMVSANESVTYKVVVASGTSNYLHDEKIAGSVTSYPKLSSRIVYDEFEVSGHPSGFNVMEYTDTGDFACRLYPGSTYCQISEKFGYSFETDSKSYSYVICLVNGTSVKAYNLSNGTSRSVSGTITLNSTLYPDRESKVVIQNINGYGHCNSEVNYPYAYSRALNINYDYTRPEDAKVIFAKDEFSCKLSYHGEPSCMVSLNSAYATTADKDATVGDGNGKPTVYVKRLDSGDISAPIQQNNGVFNGSTSGGVTHNIAIREGERDVMVGLMVMVGEEPSDQDPMIDTAMINHIYSPVEANLYIQRNILEGSLYQTFKKVHSLWYYYNDYYSIPSLNSQFPGIFVTGQECLIHIDDSTCKVQIAAQLVKGSGSIFLDGRYLGSVGEYSSATCATDRMPDNCGYMWHTIDLPEGTHKVQLFDGVGESAINNPLVAERTLVSARPVYSGSITLAPRKLRNYGASEDFIITAKANRKAYLFRKDKPDVLGHNTLNTYVDFESISYADNLPVGEYTYVLGTHPDKNDPSFEVLDEKTLTVEAEVNTITLNPVSGKEFYYNACHQAVYEQGCEITFSYQGTSQSSLSDGKPYASMCLVGSTGIIKNAGTLSRYSSFRNATSRIDNDTASIHFYDGLECPSSLNQAEIPLIGKIENLSVKADVVPSATFGQHTSFSNYELNDDVWQCFLSYEGSSDCRFYFLATPVGQVIDGKSLFSIAAWADGKDYIHGSSSGVFNTSLSTNMISDRSIDIVVCETQSASKEGCPYKPERVLVSAKVKVDVNQYEYTVSHPISDTCLLVPGIANCYVNVEVTSNAPYISVVNAKGSVVKSHSNSTQTKVNITESIDLANGGVHEYKVVTGVSAGNKVMKTFQLKARNMTDDDFNIKDSSGSIIQRNATIGSTLVIDPLALNGSLTYSVPGATIDYHNTIGPVKLFVDNVTPEQSVLDNGDGTREFVSPNYSLVNHFLASAAQKTFAVKLTWQNEVKNTNYSFHAFSVPYKLIGYSYEPYTVTPASGTSGLLTSTGSPYGTCTLTYLCLNVKNVEVNIEGTSMRGSGSCTFCASIPLRQVSFNNAVGVQKQFRVALNNGFTQHRFFYRIVDTNTISDPSVTFNGQVRPLNMDGAWHALEFETMKGGESLDFSWVGNAAGKGGIEFFGRYERD